MPKIMFLLQKYVSHVNLLGKVFDIINTHCPFIQLVIILLSPLADIKICPLLQIASIRIGILLSTPICSIRIEMSLVVREPVFGVSDQALHKLDCTATEES